MIKNKDISTSIKELDSEMKFHQKLMVEAILEEDFKTAKIHALNYKKTCNKQLEIQKKQIRKDVKYDIF